MRRRLHARTVQHYTYTDRAAHAAHDVMYRVTRKNRTRMLYGVFT